MGCGSSAQVSASAAEDAETGSNAPETAGEEAVLVENGDTTVDPLNREGEALIWFWPMIGSTYVNKKVDKQVDRCIMSPEHVCKSK